MLYSESEKTILQSLAACCMATQYRGALKGGFETLAGYCDDLGCSDVRHRLCKQAIRAERQSKQPNLCSQESMKKAWEFPEKCGCLTSLLQGTDIALLLFTCTVDALFCLATGRKTWTLVAVKCIASSQERCMVAKGRIFHEIKSLAMAICNVPRFIYLHGQAR